MDGLRPCSPSPARRDSSPLRRASAPRAPGLAGRIIRILRKVMVGVAGFEPTTPSPLSVGKRRARRRWASGTPWSRRGRGGRHLAR